MAENSNEPGTSKVEHTEEEEVEEEEVGEDEVEEEEEEFLPGYQTMQEYSKVFLGCTGPMKHVVQPNITIAKIVCLCDHLRLC